MGFDLDMLVIGGGGSGGFTAATTALKSGARVGMVEAARLGGLCILAGCMPSKTLLHWAERLRQEGTEARRHHPQVLEQKRRVVDFLAGKRVEAVQARQAKGLEVFQGRARFVDPHTVEFEGRRLSARSIVIATGSAWSLPPVPGLDSETCLLGEQFLELEELPESLVVLGGGPLALEMAQYSLRMGVDTTIVQRSPRLLSKEPAPVGELLEEALAAEGATIYTGTKLLAVEKTAGGRAVVFEHQGQERRIEAQAVLAALGRRPNSQGLNLEAAGVETSRGAVKVDRFMRTSREHIFAAGDVTGVNLVVNLAILQGEIAGYNATHPERPREIDDRVLPQAVFTDPQFARVGRRAGELEKAGVEFEQALYKLSGLGVSRTYPQPPKGFMLMRAAPADGRILGAEIVAPEAALLIHDTAVAMKLGGTVYDLAELPYVHPCLSELTNLCAGRLARQIKRRRG